MDVTKSGNLTSVSIAEEASLGVLPATPDWRERSVTSYSDFGGDINYVQDDSINPTRQNKRGIAVGIEASGGFTSVVSNEHARDMQGFLFADIDEKGGTSPIDGTAATVTSFVSANNSGQATISISTLSAVATIPQWAIITIGGMANAINNTAYVVTSKTANTITCTPTSNVLVNLVTENPAPATAVIEVVGVQLLNGQGTLAHRSGTDIVLGAVNNTFSPYGLKAGEWIFIGCDTTLSNFDTVHGYARIASVEATGLSLTLDESALVYSGANTRASNFSDTGAGKGIHVYFGKYIRNATTTADIVRRSYQLERKLGNDPNTAATDEQSEYVIGAVANELTLNLPTAERHTADFAYVGIDSEQRNGTQGVKPGNRFTWNDDRKYNTSDSVWTMRMTILGGTGLFGYASEATITVNNNVTPVNAIGSFGAVDVNTGTFEVSGDITAYFTDVASVQAIRQNRDAGFFAVLAANNQGIVYDIPLVGLSGGRLNVERDQPINIPIQNFAAENKHGYTMSYTSFPFLPNLAMPT